MFKNFIKQNIFFVLLFVLTFNLANAQEQSINKKFPKNIIVMIGDGMGRNHITATNYYFYGKDSAQVYEKFPVQLFMSTYPAVIEDNLKYSLKYDSEYFWADFENPKDGYTDSAPAATAMSTGSKTYGGSIGMDLNKQPLVHSSQVAKKLGKSIGVVTTVELSHATPAGFIAHKESRKQYSEIAQEMIDADVDVIIGAGHPDYDASNQKWEKPEYKYVGGETYWQKLKNGYKGWTLIETKQDFEKYQTGNTPKKIIGVPQVNTTLQQERKGDDKAEPIKCKKNENVPDLQTMTNVALNVLDNNPNGFFVMIEGGAIDWASHANQTGRMIEETIDFNQAVDAVVKWVETNSNWDETLLIVTADHETGYITGPKENEQNPLTNPIVNNGKGNIPDMKWNSNNHTNSLVPFFAKGAGSELFFLFADETDMIRGKFINNTEIAIAIKLLLNYSK